ncbi:MAG: adenylosuccinate synthetase [Patescibacteria group bacterium]
MHTLLRTFGNACAILGAQWGDEGKGKIIDFLTPHFDVLARAAGGANAGHTIVVGGKKHVFHLLPAGSLHPGKTVILGSGMVIHIPTLLEEIHTLKDAGVDILPRLRIARAAHVVLEEYKEKDAQIEAARTDGGIGTTKRGIGPAYAEKALRTGIRMEALQRGEKREEWTGAEILLPCIADTVSLLQECVAKEKKILIEGAQGTLLDIDHGTYPYVTSSSTTAAGALQGLGLPPRALTSCIGVAKAYCTRVGAGPFPTEAQEQDANRLRQRGGEYGATTGRPRRCGWLDLEGLRFAAALNGFTHLNLTKLDVLDEDETIHVYDHGNEPTRLPGWKQSTRGITSFEALPKNAQSYVRFIEEKVGVPVSFIGTGPERNEMIVR